jgi:ADP-ribose pyrophosphatase YjhB (NUDIX family)
VTDEHVADPAGFRVPRIAASAGAMIFDRSGRLLILKPGYKPKWTIPGGQVEPDDESPWEACRRETFEECGLRVERGRLACIDFLRSRPNPDRPGGVRFLFDCGAFADADLGTIRLQAEEIVEHRFATLEEAYELLSGPLRRRVRRSVGGRRCLYLEEGRRVDGVR